MDIKVTKRQMSLPKLALMLLNVALMTSLLFQTKRYEKFFVTKFSTTGRKTGKTINLVARPNTSFQKLTKLKQFYSLLALDVYLLLPYMLLPVITFSTDINT